MLEQEDDLDFLEGIPRFFSVFQRDLESDLFSSNLSLKNYTKEDFENTLLNADWSSVMLCDNV